MTTTSTYVSGLNAVNATYDKERTQIDEEYASSVDLAQRAYELAQDEAKAQLRLALEAAVKERTRRRRIARDRFFGEGRRLRAGPSSHALIEGTQP